CARELGGYW
nr:immunoglobulin heavy chain junction region [Mus musculus]